MRDERSATGFGSTVPIRIGSLAPIHRRHETRTRRGSKGVTRVTDFLYLLANVSLAVGFWAASFGAVFLLFFWMKNDLPNDDVRTPTELRMLFERVLLFTVPAVIALVVLYVRFHDVPSDAQPAIAIHALFDSVQPTNLFVAAHLGDVFRVACFLVSLPLAVSVLLAIYDFFYPWERRFFDRHGRTPAQYAAEMSAMVRRMNQMFKP